MLLSRHVLGSVGVMSGVPAVLTEFCWSLARLVQFTEQYLCQAQGDIRYLAAPYSDHAPARNDLVNRMEGEWILFLDTDLEFPPDLLLRLLDRMVRADLDVVTGLYRLKSPPHTPCLFLWDQDRFRPLAQTPQAPLFQIAAAGAGCLLVRRRVFARIWRELREKPFDRLDHHSEDLSFFLRLQRLGIPAWCDRRIEAGHLRTRPTTAADQPAGLADPAGMDVGALR